MPKVIQHTLVDGLLDSDGICDTFKRLRCPWCGALPEIESYYWRAVRSGWRYKCGTEIQYLDIIRVMKYGISVRIEQSYTCEMTVEMNMDDQDDVI